MPCWRIGGEPLIRKIENQTDIYRKHTVVRIESTRRLVWRGTEGESAASASRICVVGRCGGIEIKPGKCAGSFLLCVCSESKRGFRQACIRTAVIRSAEHRPRRRRGAERGWSIGRGVVIAELGRVGFGCSEDRLILTGIAKRSDIRRRCTKDRT